MRVLGITGGSGTGKSTATGVLRELGALVLDCDVVYRELLSSGGELLSALEARFPGSAPGGRLDSKRLGELVFSDPQALEELNRVTHSHVARELLSRIDGERRRGGALAVVDAIAIFESGFDRSCDAVVAVLAPVERRLERIMARDGISREYAAKRIAAQPPDEFYRARCAGVLVNDFDRAEDFAACCREYFPRRLEGELPWRT